MYHRLVIVALAVVVPQIASAQFTTFIPPQNKVADSIKAAVAVQQKAHADSVATMHVRNMQTWVDSAAGVAPAPAPATAADSLAARLATANARALDTTAFRNGARAPATASDLPMLALLGAAAFVAGMVLLAVGPPTRKRA